MAVLFCMVAFTGWTWDAFDFFTVSLTTTQLAKTFDKTEWFPSIIASGRYLGLLPETTKGADTIHWVPVDIFAQTVMELTNNAQNTSPSPNSLQRREPTVQPMESPSLRYHRLF
ncbi:hypothetical protein N7532_004139 [Penicillium argentinense]|uniref:Uncharacterized protein n=1 Tax=Penicillium argentinense TaxID=1131581 RepID=A0A9W9FP97_9EURO|nr:uncharacterized protein N7532_004139 [Penicillium argentinense]KAJ5103610.1 hypothetical protein N7532_004139 [Penicillium argentinense]